MKTSHKILLKFLFGIIFFIITSHSTQAQVEKDTLLASQYFKKGDFLITDKKLDSALVYFNKALSIYQKSKTWKETARCYNKIAKVYWYNNKFKESFQNANNALEICNRYLEKHNSEKADTYDNIGYYYQDIYDYKTALDYHNKALQIRRRIFPKTHKDIALSYYNIGYLKQSQGRYGEALKNHEKALAIRIATLGENHHATSASYYKVGFAHISQGNYEKTIFNYKKALDIRVQIYGADHAQTSEIYSRIGYAYLYGAEYKKAEIFLKKGLKTNINNFGEKHNNTATSYYIMAMLYRRVGKYELAENNFKKALPIYIELSDGKSTNVAKTYYSLGIVLNFKGLYDNAIDNYNKSLKIYSATKSTHPTIALIYNDLGNSFLAKGAYKKALEFYKKSLNITTKTIGKNHYQASFAYINMALAYMYQENYDQALIYNKKALHIRTNIFSNDHPKIAVSHSQIGEISLLKKQYKEALQNYKRALHIYSNKFDDNHSYIAEILGKIGATKLKMGLFKEALDYFNRSLEIRQKTYKKNNAFIAESYNNIAKVYFASEAYQNALDNYKKAHQANSKPDRKFINNNSLNRDNFLDLNTLLTTITGKAKTYTKLHLQNHDSNNLKNAILSYQIADTLINHTRQTFTNYQDKIDFAKKTQEIYQEAIATQLLQKDQKSLEKAFYYVEKSKSNTLKELLNDANAKNFTGLPENLVVLEKELRINHSFYQSKITEEQSEQKIDTIKVTHYENKLFDINRKQDSLTQVLEKNYPKYYHLKYQNNIVSVANIQQKLDDNTTVLEFFTGDSITYAFTVSKNAIAVKELPTPKLTKQVEEFRKSITSKNTIAFKQEAQSLYNQLIAPIADQIVGDNLIIIPDGSLWHLNFELLLTQKDDSNNPALLSYLLRDYAITYANSANLLFTTFKNDLKQEILQECLAFSFSDSTQTTETRAMPLAALRDTGEDLPGTRKEIRAISKIIDGQYYFGSQAIEVNFKKNAGQYNILHLALHGDVDNERPENSKLYFTKSKDTIEDNLLYSHELFALDIPAELTVLSACNTGTGKIAKGEGIMSLGTAFQYAGTKSLLLTSWEVSDQTTPELMQYFYTNLKKGMNKAKALQQAKLQYLTTANINRTAPFYWGGFYLVGDSAPMYFKNNSFLYWSIGILIVVLVGGLFWYRRKTKS